MIGPHGHSLDGVARLAVIVLGASAVAVLALALVRPALPTATLRASNPEVGNDLQAVGTIYAVLLAFVVYVVWGQFDAARKQVDHEANEVIDLFRTADGFPAAARAHVQRELTAYVAAVIREEWPAMATHGEAVLERTAGHLDRVWDGLHCLAPADDCQRALHGEALSRFNDLSDARTERLTSARMRIPFGLKLLLYVGAFVMVASMFLVQVDSFAIHAIMTGAMAGAVSHVLYLVIDLDDVRRRVACRRPPSSASSATSPGASATAPRRAPSRPAA
jgi:hypothetical protein